MNDETMNKQTNIWMTEKQRSYNIIYIYIYILISYNIY